MVDRRNWLIILLVSLFATLTFVTIPRYPYLIDDALSEKAVLSYAHEHNFQYGKDIVFTYGPLGFLVSRYFFAHQAGVRLATDFATSFAGAFGVALLALHIGRQNSFGDGRMRWIRAGQIWGWLLLIIFVFLTANIDPRADLVLYIGLFSWGLLCFLESGRELALAMAVFILLGVFSVLVKANFLVLVGLSAALIIVDLAIRDGRPSRNLGAAICMAIGFIFAFLAGWIAAGQSVWNIKAFFVNSIPIVIGYDQTVGLEGLQALQQRGWMTLPLIFAAVAIRALTAYSHRGARSSSGAASNAGSVSAEHSQPARSINAASPDGQRSPNAIKLSCRRALLFVWLSTLVFIIWKHGFVRAGLFHSGFYFGLVPIMALALEAIPTEHFKARNWTRGTGGVCCLLCLFTLQSFFFQSPGSAMLQPVRAIPTNLRALLKPGEFKRQMLEVQENEVADTELPRVRKIVGNSSVDVFGQAQSYAIFNGLNYRPRPIFQSYMAYNTPLMQMNEQFYFSPAAPDYVLFRLGPVDRRYAPLEDAAVLRDLLADYEPVAGENQFLLLRPKGDRTRAKLKPLREGTVRPGEPILLTDNGQTDLWLEVTIKPTLAGHARQLFYKPPIVRMAMWHNPSKQGASWFRAPAPMLDAGFVASPMLANTEDALNLYADTAITRPYACSIEVGAGNERYWRDTISYRLYKIENTLGRCARDRLPQLLGYAGFQVTPTEINASSNAFVRVESKPAFFLPIGGFIRLTAPKNVTRLEGKWGLGTSPIDAQPADFRVEEEMTDGTARILQSHVANPGEYGMQKFTVLFSGDAEHRIILRTAPTLPAKASEAKHQENDKPVPLSCWADVRFN